MLGIEAQSELYLRFDSSGIKIGISRGRNVFHGSIVDFTGLAQKQPISRARGTMKKEEPCGLSLLSKIFPTHSHKEDSSCFLWFNHAFISCTCLFSL